MSADLRERIQSAGTVTTTPPDLDRAWRRGRRAHRATQAAIAVAVLAIVGGGIAAAMSFVSPSASLGPVGADSESLPSAPAWARVGPGDVSLADLPGRLSDSTVETAVELAYGDPANGGIVDPRAPEAVNGPGRPRPVSLAMAVGTDGRIVLVDRADTGRPATLTFVVDGVPRDVVASDLTTSPTWGGVALVAGDQGEAWVVGASIADHSRLVVARYTPDTPAATASGTVELTADDDLVGGITIVGDTVWVFDAGYPEPTSWTPVATTGDGGVLLDATAQAAGRRDTPPDDVLISATLDRREILFANSSWLDLDIGTATTRGATTRLNAGPSSNLSSSMVTGVVGERVGVLEVDGGAAWLFRGDPSGALDVTALTPSTQAIADGLRGFNPVAMGRDRHIYWVETDNTALRILRTREPLPDPGPGPGVIDGDAG